MNKNILLIIACLMAWVNSMSAEDKIYVTDFSITAEETKEVSVQLDNTISYVAFQFDLYLPEGITLTGYEVNGSRVPESTEVSMAKMADGSFRFIAAAMSMEEITGNSGGIVTLKLKASSEIATGNKTGYLKKVKLSKSDATGFTTAEIPYAVKVLAPITVTAKSYTRKYGEDNPSLEYDVTGDIEGVPSLSCEATATSPVGTYPIVVSKGGVTNYNGTYVNGTLTIEKTPLTVTAKSYTIKQGEALPTFELTYDGFKNSETNNVLTKQPTITCAATTSKVIGIYDIVVSDADAENYDISYVAGTLTIMEKESYTLTYVVDGAIYKTYQVRYRGSITAEAEPTKEGYTFSGWSEIPTTMPAEDVTVTGSFTINSYKLIYKVDGEEYKALEVEYGADITSEAAPTKEGFTFSGWSLIPEKMPAMDVTVTGSFTINKYKLAYMVDGTEYKTFDVEYGADIISEAAPTKEGYTFSGWSEIPETMPAKDVTVTGSFTINKYKLVYKVDEEEYKSYDVEYGAIITAETEPTKEGYSFSGWSLIPEKMPAKDVTVTGSFTKGQYKLTYMLDGETYKTISIDFGTAITAENAPIKEGYTFSGWSEIPATMPAKDVVVTGSFTINSYKLAYMVDGTEYKTFDVEYGADITSEAAPTKEGFTFSGWSLIPEKMPAKDVTVTGSFTIDSYKLIYKVDEEEYKTYDVEYGVDITPETEPTKEGYTFSGWSLIPETMPAKDVTVTGSFTINKYKLVYKVDDEVYKVYDVEYDADIVAEAAPTKNGYTFSGWTLIPEKMPSHDVTVTGWFVKDHDTFEEDGAGYEMNEDKTVTFTKQENGSGTCEIPASVVIDGQKYQVTAIAEGAFKDNTNLKELSIPESIASIGVDAFAGCTNLGKINLYSDKPISLNQADASSVFSGVDTENCILYVPVGTAEAYRQAEGWKVFKNIVEMEDPDEISDVNADNGEYRIYTLDGKQVEALQKGVNIIRYSNGSTQKVFVK